MSDERGAVELTKNDQAEQSDGTPDSVSEHLDAADTDEARANYATFAVALGKSAEAHSDPDEAVDGTDHKVPDADGEVPEADDELPEAVANPVADPQDELVPDAVADTDDADHDSYEADDFHEVDDLHLADNTAAYSGLEEAEAPDADDGSADAETVVVSAEPDAEAKPKRIWQRDIWRRQIAVKPIPVILVLLLLFSGGLATWMYFQKYQPDQLTSQSVARTVINSASEGTVAVLSYSPDSLDKDFAGARSHLSGDFLSYYDQFTQQFVAPASKQKALKTTARVMRAAVQELRPTSAVVLLFVDQSTTSKDNPEPSVAARAVQVTLALVDGKWLITKFTPV